MPEYCERILELKAVPGRDYLEGIVLDVTPKPLLEGAPTIRTHEFTCFGRALEQMAHLNLGVRPKHSRPGINGLKAQPLNTWHPLPDHKLKVLLFVVRGDVPCHDNFYRHNHYSR